MGTDNMLSMKLVLCLFVLFNVGVEAALRLGYSWQQNNHFRQYRDQSCRSYEDCRKDGKKCENITDVTCICKNGQCKISSNCGIYGAFFFTACSDPICNEENCEDVGACKWVAGECLPNRRPALNRGYSWPQNNHFRQYRGGPPYLAWEYNRDGRWPEGIKHCCKGVPGLGSFCGCYC